MVWENEEDGEAPEAVLTKRGRELGIKRIEPPTRMHHGMKRMTRAA